MSLRTSYNNLTVQITKWNSVIHSYTRGWGSLKVQVLSLMSQMMKTELYAQRSCEK